MVLGERFRLKRLHGHRFGLTLRRFVSRGFGLLQWFLGESWPVRLRGRRIGLKVRCPRGVFGVLSATFVKEL